LKGDLESLTDESTYYMRKKGVPSTHRDVSELESYQPCRLTKSDSTAAKNYIIITVFNVGENEGVRAPNFSSGKVTKSW